MVIVKLQEGLGNQLFQYFFGKSLLKKNVVFDSSFYSFQSSRQLELNNFENFQISYLTDSIKDFTNFTIVKDNFQFEIPEIKDDQNYYFDGYWHNKKFLLPIRDFIIEKASPSEKLESYVRNKYPFLFDNECISLHIRRNDYTNLSRYYHNLDIEYYSKSLDIIGVSNKKIIVFSDDIEWCKNNLPYDNCIFINQTPRVDLYMMSLCQYNIIANSTFSFWSAFLNKNAKKIIAPINWYKEEYSMIISQNTEKDCAKHLILDDWIRI